MWFIFALLVTGLHGLAVDKNGVGKRTFRPYPWNLSNMHTGGGDDDYNFYKFFNDITDGMIFNGSNINHELLEMMGHHWPNPDPGIFPSFNCSVERPPSYVKATSVNELTPFDIDVIAAMGDSLTAGFGALAYTLVDLFVEFRGVSWSIGGEADLKKHITLPNILRMYNPKLKGYSLGITPALVAVPWEHLNVAVSGATAFGLMDQAKDFVYKLKTIPQYNLLEDWKVLTLFIGGNDLCSCCRKYRGYDKRYTPEHYIEKIRDVLDYLQSEVPRLFVNMVNAPDVTILHNLKSVKCDITHFIECKCGTIMGKAARDYTANARDKYIQLLEELVVKSGRYKKKKDFAAVLQPFFDETELPRNKDGSVDMTYWAPDCFHFSGKAHGASALALWNSMFQPVGKKTTTWKAGEVYRCPTAKKPYIYTNRNSEAT